MSNVAPRYKILIVEDELLVAADIQESLRKANYEVVGVAEDYSQTLRLTERHHPDLILIDIALRGAQDGIAAATAIRERWQIPVVFLTGNADEATVSKARSAGPQAFLTKPFREEALQATVRIALDQYHLSQELFASQQWLTAVLGSLTDAVIAVDSRGFVRSLNPAAEELTRCTPSETTGKTVEQFCHLSEFDGTPVKNYPALKSIVTGLPINKQRLLLKVRNGSNIPVEVFAAPVVENEEVLGSIMVMANITARLISERQQELERDKLDEQARTATEALGQTRAELRALAGNLMTAQEDERRRVARELHDDLGQKAALLGWTADAISQQMPESSTKGRAAVDRLTSQVAQLCDGLRDLSHRLHPSIIKDLGVARALEELADNECEQGRDIRFVQSNVPSSLPVERATALYRIAQEALRNAGKHAAGAPVTVTLSGNETEVELCIKDDGQGFSPLELRTKGGLGLVSMQERARLAGGGMSLNTSTGQGTTILVRMPIGE